MTSWRPRRRHRRHPLRPRPPRRSPPLLPRLRRRPLKQPLRREPKLRRPLRLRRPRRSPPRPRRPQPAPVAAAAASDPNSPIGIWATEENKGNVRIEECGANLCGYSVNTGARILINMKPQGSKWAGRIHDPDSGRNYDSTIALKGADTLKVQGCAFGGMFCGGQTWKRVS